MYGEEFCKQLSEDYLDTCKNSELITEDKIKIRLHSQIYRAALRIFAPLM